ncbi:MAG: hypothetical protein R3B49_02605 [Phycisphaerales bacterium]
MSFAWKKTGWILTVSVGGVLAPAFAEPPAAGLAPAPEAAPEAATESKVDAKADEVLSKAIAATWGKTGEERSIKSVAIVASLGVPAQGISAPVHIWFDVEHGNARTEYTIPNYGTESQGVWNGKGWASSDITGARLLEGEEAKDAIRQSDFYADLDFKNSYVSRKYMGTEEIDGKACEKIQLVRAEGDRPELHWYDAETGLQLRQQATESTQMGDISAVTDFSDYRDVEGAPGLKMPFKTTVSVMGMQQIVTIESITINPELTEDQVAPPPAVKKLMG